MAGQEDIALSNSEIFRIISKDGVIFEAPKELIQHSRYLDTHCNQLEENDVELSEIDSDTIKILIEIANLDMEELFKIPKPLPYRFSVGKYLGPWYSDVLYKLRFNQRILFKLMKASEFLLVDPIIDLCYSIIADLHIKGKMDECVAHDLELPVIQY